MIHQGGFWSVDLGNVLTAVALLISFWAAHASNAKRAQQNISEFQDIKTKVNLIYEWFMTSVVGRESPRRNATRVADQNTSGDD